jgi:hypothetical protein
MSDMRQTYYPKPIHRRRWPVAWLWLVETAISWALVIAAGYGLTALLASLR